MPANNYARSQPTPAWTPTHLIPKIVRPKPDEKCTHKAAFTVGERYARQDLQRHPNGVPTARRDKAARRQLRARMLVRNNSVVQGLRKYRFDVLRDIEKWTSNGNEKRRMLKLERKERHDQKNWWDRFAIAWHLIGEAHTNPRIRRRVNKLIRQQEAKRRGA